jgi:ribosomal protein S18 acetylase RimI-like enzyme
LTGVLVHSDFQGRGMGHALMATAVDFMPEAGHRRAILGVIQANVMARGLYESGGWSVVELRERNAEGVPVATMGIKLK